MNTKLYEKIARDLCAKYPHYYDTVHFYFIVCAVENSIKDIHSYDLEKLHANITEYYI